MIRHKRKKKHDFLSRRLLAAKIIQVFLLYIRCSMGDTFSSTKSIVNVKSEEFALASVSDERHSESEVK